jgi:hypothetical protein
MRSSGRGRPRSGQNRNTRHECENFTDQALIDLGDDVEITGLPLLLALAFSAMRFFSSSRSDAAFSKSCAVDGRLLLTAHGGNAIVEFAKIRRCGHATNAQA